MKNGQKQQFFQALFDYAGEKARLQNLLTTPIQASFGCINRRLRVSSSSAMYRTAMDREE
jgi:hypothetical protein